jgi:glutamate-1-semialdehyde 2,1-aminomutase
VKTLAIVQARMSSTRLPKKVMLPIAGRPMIEILLARLAKSQSIGQIILATSLDQSNDILVDYVTNLGYQCYRGSEKDVLDRYYQAYKLFGGEVIIRITGDCPLVDPVIIDFLVNKFINSHVDYLSNTLDPTYPDGLDVEVFSGMALEKAYLEALEPGDREHVTPYIKFSGIFSTLNHTYVDNYSDIRLTVDEPEDINLVRKIADHFYPRLDFSFEEILSLKSENPSLFNVNAHHIRNEGSSLSTGQKLWKRAKRVIPGGNMLLSKRSEMFLPEKWPAYYSKAKGCNVWDLDGVQYLDLSIMGIGTNILGYGHPEVDAAASNAIYQGNMSTLNCTEEVSLAELLIELHPWAKMVRFARTGGEANAIAIRIARAASGRDGVAFCGYHGWHDWYLSANIGEHEGLDGHLLPGLAPNGVPRSLINTAFPFQYNNYAGLEKLIANNKSIGTIKMEVIRNIEPSDNFLEKVRDLATRNGIVLIFDECTSGFRETLGGIHLKYGVQPDIAMFGKALGNGYAITAVIGREEVMQSAQTSFISSTFWTERIGPSAALKTIEIMKRLRSWETITSQGLNVKKRWQELADSSGLKISHFGIPSLASFNFDSKNNLAYKTLITQEMLKKNYLATTTLYCSIEHTSNVIDGYFEALTPIFEMIKNCEDGYDYNKLLEGPICHAGFMRLN